MIEVQAKKEAWSKDLLWLAGILLAALVLRLVAFSSFYQLDPEAIRSPDSATYEGPALAFVAHGKFLDRPNMPDVPMLLRTPGYPAFIAAVYAVVGTNEEALIVVQIVVSLGTIFLVWWIGRMLWPGAAGLLAAALLLAAKLCNQSSVRASEGFNAVAPAWRRIDVAVWFWHLHPCVQEFFWSAP